MKKIILYLFTLFCVVGANAQSDSTLKADTIVETDAYVDESNLFGAPPKIEEGPGETHYVGQMPVFPGGEDSMMKFISKNIVYPKPALKNKIEGTIRVSFIVEKDGSVSNVITLGKKLGEGLEEESIRIIKMLPKFSPAKQNGKPGRFKMVVPIKFKLNQ